MTTETPAHITQAVADCRMAELRCRECRGLLLVYQHAPGSETWVRCIRCRLWYALIVN